MVARWLVGGHRLIDLDGLAATSGLPAAIGAPVVDQVDAPYVALDDEKWADRLPGRLRSTISRSRKRLEREGYTVRRVPPEEVDRGIAVLRALHEERWQDESALDAGWDRIDRIARAGAASGGFVLHELADDEGRVIASEAELVVGSRVSFYQAGRLTDHELRGSGSVLRAAIIDWAVRSGHDELDLLRGGENYKDDWATGVRRITRARGGAGVSGRGSAAIANATKRFAPAVLGAVERVAGPERADALTRRVVATVRHQS
jgi:CelD/BcsL family acetyltransferase involved in cellulose biosynthesis